MRRLSIILLLIVNFTYQNGQAQTPVLRRVCSDVNNNNLFWSNSVTSCSSFNFYLIWGRNGTSGSYILIDTVKAISVESYTHLNANIGPGSPNWYYYIERRDSCNFPYNHYSDTLNIDIDPPEETLFDSVSVDVATNQVKIGWPSNKTPDFDKYYIWLFSGSPTLLTSSGIRDTFFTDVVNNPATKSLSYDIYPQDSCGNPGVLGLSKHSTIFLQHTIDTCLRQYKINWSHYVGWNGIFKYYIFKKNDTGPFSLIDSVDGTINTYTGKYTPGVNHQIFVRAIKTGNTKITSSSNSIQFTTAPKNDPSFISINHFSSLAPNTDGLVFSIHAELNKDVSGYEVSIYDANMGLRERLDLKTADIDKDIFLSYRDNERWFLTTAAKDYCNNSFFWGDTSTNIVLAGLDTLEARRLNWNPYFKWDSGIEEYVVSRGTGDDGAVQLAEWAQTNDTSIVDQEIIQEIKNRGVCYFVEASQKGNPTRKAKSNMVCLSTSFTVFVPNAFVPSGINNRFRPEGSSINYEKSTITVYNRWGQEIYAGIIGSGWDGLDQNGIACSSGVYHYNLEIISSENEKQTRNGYVTLLR